MAEQVEQLQKIRTQFSAKIGGETPAPGTARDLFSKGQVEEGKEIVVEAITAATRETCLKVLPRAQQDSFLEGESVPNELQSFAEYYDWLCQQYPTEFKVPYAQFMREKLQQSSSQALRGAEVAPTAPRAAEATPPPAEALGTSEKGPPPPTVQSSSQKDTKELIANFEFPDRPEVKPLDLKTGQILDKESAREILHNTEAFKKLSPREQARIKELAAVKEATSNIEEEVGSQQIYRPYGFFLSEIIDRYEQAEDWLRDKVLRDERHEIGTKAVEDPDDKEKKISIVVADPERENPDRNPNWYLVASTRILLSVVGRKRFVDDERDRFFRIMNSWGKMYARDESAKTAEQLKEFEQLHYALYRYGNAIFNLVEFWHEGIASHEEPLQISPKAAAKMATAIGNDVLYVWLHDREIEKAVHLASSKYMDEADFETGLVWTGGKTEKTYPVDTFINYQGQEVQCNLRQSRRQAAFDVIGEMLNVATLKVIKDPAQAGQYAYSYYKAMQTMMQGYEGKYRFQDLARSLTVDKAGHISFVVNNGMFTLATFPNSGEIVNTWFDLMKKSLDWKDTGMYLGERNLAALISWHGDYDSRTPHNDNAGHIDGEMLDFDWWMLLKDPVRQRTELKRHLTDFFSDKYDDDERKEIIRGNISRIWTRQDEGKKLDTPLVIFSPWTGEYQMLECLLIKEPVLDLDDVWFNPKTHEDKLCFNFRWMFQQNPGYPLVGVEKGEGELIVRRALGQVDEKPIHPYFSREGQISGQKNLDLATMFVYLVYFLSDSAAEEKLLKSGAMSLLQEQMKALTEITGEDHGKYAYSLPEYYPSVVTHFINDIVKKVLYPGIYFDRWTGRAMEFLQQARQWGRFLDFHIDKKVDFESTNTDGSWAESSKILRLSSPALLRMMLMRGAHRPTWEHFAQSKGLSLTEFLTYVGVQEKNHGVTRKNADGAETGYMQLELIEEAHQQEWQTMIGKQIAAGNVDNATKKLLTGKFSDWRKRDNPELLGRVPSIWASKIAELDQARLAAGKAPLLSSVQDVENFFQLNKIFSKWDLWRATRRIVSEYVDDVFDTYDAIPDFIMYPARKDPRGKFGYDRAFAEVAKDRDHKKRAYDGKLYGDASRDPKSLRWKIFEYEGRPFYMWDVWKRRQIENKILREHQFPMGDTSIAGRYMFTQFDDLEFKPDGTPNLNYQMPKLMYAKTDELGRPVQGSYHYLSETGEAGNGRARALAYLDYREKVEAGDLKFHQRHEEYRAQYGKAMSIELEQNLRREIEREIGVPPDQRAFFAQPFSGVNPYLGVCPALDLAGGLWEFEQEGGLNERWPDYLEKDLYIWLTSMWTPPYRMWVAERMADEQYKMVHPEVTVATLTPDIRKSHEWQELFEKHREEQQAICIGPDGLQRFFDLARSVYLGEGGVDEKPILELKRIFGVDNREAVDKYFKQIARELNWREGELLPPLGDPDKIKEVQARHMNMRKKDLDGYKKFLLVEAMPPGWENIFSALVLGGNSIPELIESGQTDRDTWAKVTRVAPGVAAGLAGLGLFFTPYAGFGLAPLLIEAAIKTGIPLALSYPLFRLGWIAGKDRAEGSIVDMEFKYIPIIGPTIKVDSESIKNHQTGKGGYHGFLNQLLYLIPNWPPSLQKLRLEIIKKGMSHPSIVKHEQALQGYITQIKKLFGSQGPKAG